MRFAIILLFLLNLIAGLYFINEGIFHHDTVVLAQAVEGTYETGRLQPAVRGRYGMVIINTVLYLPFFILGQNADFTVRFSSVLFHSFSVVALFLFIRGLFGNDRHAFFGALLFSFTPFYFSPNTWGKEHGASIFFLLLSFYLLYRGANKNSAPLVFISSILFAFAVSIKESALVAVPLCLLLYLGPGISIRPFAVNIPKERFDPKMLASLIFPFSVLFCVMFFTYLRPEFYREIFIRDTASAAFLGLFSPAFKKALADLYISVPLLIFLFFAVGIKRLYDEKKFFLLLFLLLWSLTIFYFGNLKSYGPRYMDIAIIPVYIVTSYVLSGLYGKDRIIASSILFYFVLSMFLFMYPMLEFRRHYNGEKRFALYVAENTDSSAIIITMDDGPFIEYYGKRKYMTHPVNPRDDGETAFFIEEVKGYLKSGVPVYLTQSGLGYDRNKALQKELFKSFDISIAGEKLSEDYHRPELKLRPYSQKLYKLGLKNK